MSKNESRSYKKIYIFIVNPVFNFFNLWPYINFIIVYKYIQINDFN